MMTNPMSHDLLRCKVDDYLMYKMTKSNFISQPLTQYLWHKDVFLCFGIISFFFVFPSFRFSFNNLHLPCFLFITPLFQFYFSFLTFFVFRFCFFLFSCSSFFVSSFLHRSLKFFFYSINYFVFFRSCIYIYFSPFFFRLLYIPPFFFHSLLSFYRFSLTRFVSFVFRFFLSYP